MTTNPQTIGIDQMKRKIESTQIKVEFFMKHTKTIIEALYHRDKSIADAQFQRDKSLAEAYLECGNAFGRRSIIDGRSGLTHVDKNLFTIEKEN
jgi:hypothetical protein